MSSLNAPLEKLVCLFLTGLLLSFATPLQADDGGSMIWEAHDQLQQASETTDTARVDHLQQALTLLKNLPPVRYGRHRKAAIHYIHTALFEINRGDPDHKADFLIQDAETQVHFLKD